MMTGAIRRCDQCSLRCGSIAAGCGIRLALESHEIAAPLTFVELALIKECAVLASPEPQLGLLDPARYFRLHAGI
jgi:hypothetical protein